MVFATGIPFAGMDGLPEMLEDLAGLMPRSAGVRRFGAAALDLAWVAAGRFDGFWERRLNAWDVAAGALLVREAGGFVQDIRDPRANPVETGSIIAGNAEGFDRFAALIRR